MLKDYEQNMYILKNIKKKILEATLKNSLKQMKTLNLL